MLKYELCGSRRRVRNSKKWQKVCLEHLPIFFNLAGLFGNNAIQFDAVAPPTQGTWRSNDYVSAVRLVDIVSSMEWVGELIIYIWSD